MNYPFYSMAAEAPKIGQRSFVEISRNGTGVSVKIPVPFFPEDRIDLSSLWPRSAFMLMVLYNEQKISVFPHGTGIEEVIYNGNGLHK